MLGAADAPCSHKPGVLMLVKSSCLDRRVLLRDFIGNLLPQRLLKQKLQSLTNIINTKVFQSYGESSTRCSLHGPARRCQGWSDGAMSPPQASPPLPRYFGSLGAGVRTPPALRPLLPTECRELLLHTAVPILQELIEKGEEEDACIELLSNILEVLYKAQKVKPGFSAGPPSPSRIHLGKHLVEHIGAGLSTNCCPWLGWADPGPS